MLFLAFLAVVGVLAYRASSPEDRIHLARWGAAHLIHLAEWRRTERDAFQSAARERLRWPVAAPVIAFLNLVVFLALVMGPASSDRAHRLLAWGASSGPLTTNGEWWRLLTAGFVHDGWWLLAVNIAVFIQVGFIVERMAGPVALLTAYLGAGVLAGLTSMAIAATAVTSGASASIYGVLGLFLSALIGGWFHRSPLSVPFSMLVRLAPLIALFVIQSALSDSLPASAEMVGVAAGLILGVTTARRLDVAPPQPRRLRVAVAAGLVVMLACAIPLRGITDIEPTIEAIARAEQRSAAGYEAAVDRFRRSKVTVEELVRLIDQSIVPELVASTARLEALTGVPWADQPRIEVAKRYLTLRAEGWRVRSKGLRETTGGGLAARLAPSGAPEERGQAEERYLQSSRTFGKAELLEREALDALTTLRPLP